MWDKNVYFTVNGSRQAYFCLVGGKKVKHKISLLVHVGKNANKIKNKSWKAAFFSCRRQFLHDGGLVDRKYSEVALLSHCLVSRQ